jgi:hypothetical protein
MNVSGHQLLLALLIGSVVFAIAALWPLSEWAVTAPRQWALPAALFVVAACVALDTHGLAFQAMLPGTWRWAIAHALEWTTLPLFIALPDAVCVASGQSLARAGVSARVARMVSLLLAAVAVVVAPFGLVIGGCGLAGACF